MNIHKRTRLTEIQRKELWEKYKNGTKVSTLSEIYLTSKVIYGIFLMQLATIKSRAEGFDYNALKK